MYLAIKINNNNSCNLKLENITTVLLSLNILINKITKSPKHIILIKIQTITIFE